MPQLFAGRRWKHCGILLKLGGVLSFWGDGTRCPKKLGHRAILVACAAETEGGIRFGASGNKRVLCDFISDKSPTLGLGNVASLCAHVLRFWWAHPMQVVFQYIF